MDNKVNNIEMREKIRTGLALACKKLVRYKAKNDGFLVFSNQGKIVKMLAKDIEL